MDLFSRPFSKGCSLKLKGLKYLMQSLQGQIINAESPIKIEDPSIISSKVKFEVYGEEMLGKDVKISGNSGRVYLPPAWIGKHVKIIRID